MGNMPTCDIAIIIVCAGRHGTTERRAGAPGMNTKYVKAGLDESTEDFQDDFVQKLQDAVRNVKASREMEERYMLLEELLKEERENGRIEGKAEGKVEGKVEGKAESILELLSDLGEVPEELRKKILGEKDLDILKSYLKKASASKTIEEFQKLIDQS